MGHVKIVQLLLQHSGDMNASDDQYRTPLPLHVAAEYGFGGASATTQALESHDNSVSPPTSNFTHLLLQQPHLFTSSLSFLYLCLIYDGCYSIEMIIVDD
jgi:hypothetical protein